MNPGAGWGAKCWPAESYGAVARALQERGLAVVINHGPGEEALADAVRVSSEGVALPVKCSVGELISLTRRASLFVGGDTGPMHLAAALRVPVVALFGPTRPERNGPYGTKSIVLRNPQSTDNSSHTDEPDEGLTGDSTADGDRRGQRVAGRAGWLIRKRNLPGRGTASRAVFACRWDSCLRLSTSGGLGQPGTAFCIGVVVACFGLVIRALASGQVKKDRELTTTGPYAYVRNPLYLGSILLGIGFALAARDLWVVVFLVVYFVLIYVPVIQGEQTYLRSQFPGLRRVHATVPSLVPRTLWFPGVTNGFSRELYFRHREYNSLLGAAAIVVVLIAKIFLFPGQR